MWFCTPDNCCVLGDLGRLVCAVRAAVRPVYNRSGQAPHCSTGELKQDPKQLSLMSWAEMKLTPHYLFSFCRCFITSAWRSSPSSWWSWHLSCTHFSSSFSTISLRCLMELSWSCPSSWISCTSPKKTPLMAWVCSSCSGCGEWPGSLMVCLTWLQEVFRGKWIFL